jgi:Bacterial Ig domain
VAATKPGTLNALPQARQSEAKPSHQTEGPLRCLPTTALAALFVLIPPAHATPSVSFDAPLAGSTVSGKIVEGPACEVTASIDASRVDFYLDGQFLHAQRYPPWNCEWDTTQMPDGEHELTAEAIDATGNSTTTSVRVTVANPMQPTVEFRAPLEGDRLSGRIQEGPACEVTGSAETTRVEFYLDGQFLWPQSFAPWNCELDSTQVPDGEHRLSASAFDAGGRSSTTEIGVHIANQRSRVGSFETGNLSEFDGSGLSGGNIVTTAEEAYDGTRAARIDSDGIAENQFQRVWYDVNWGPGADVWYGLALKVPRLADWCWWRPVRWDNHKTYAGAGDVGGVRIEAGKLYLDAGSYGQRTRTLIGPIDIPEGRWFWLEVHQRFSDRPNVALSELFVDGGPVGTSTQPNSNGRVINHLRFGNVTLASGCSSASSVYFDRISVGLDAVGPLE